jgi:subtilase family serine protease
MRFKKHHAWPVVLALVCLLTGFFASAPIPVMNGQAFADTRPDLTIGSISWAPEVPSLQNTVTFTTTIKNQGDCQAPLSCIAYYIDDTLVNTAEINPIEAHDTIVNSFIWQATAGEHNIKAVIDSNNVIDESNEDNNTKVYAFSVIAADLIIESITWSPQITSAGSTVTFTVTVKNQGNKVASHCWAEFFIDGASRSQRVVGRLEPGESKTIDYTWIAQAGEHTLKATADILNQAVESDETNNDLTQNYTTTPPDLIISSIVWSPPDRIDTDNVTMHVTVKNNGLGTAHSSQLTFYVDGKLQASVSINSLNPGAVTTKTYTWWVGPEKHTFTAIIDPNNFVIESYDNNNTYTVTLPALGPPDLLIQSITWTPTQPTVNSIMTFTITVKNAGKVAVDKCYLDFYAAQGHKINRELGPIPAGCTYSVDIGYICSTVPINVRAILDPNNYIAESDETNNEKTASLTPIELIEAEFYMTSLTCTPNNPAVGDEVTIKAKLKNNTNYSVGESNIAFYVDGTLVETVVVKRLSPKANAYYSITWTATPGTHTIKAVADFNDNYAESNESNNTKEIVISTLSPDLAIDSISWTPEIPSTGDALTITLTIINQGTYKSGGCYIGYYVDSSYQGNHYIGEIAPGGTVTRTFPWTLMNSLQTFKIIIDEDNSVPESDESNNEKTAVIPAPDLIIESMTYSPEDFTENSTITFVVTIENTGASQSESTYLDFYINNVLQTSVSVTPILAGESKEVIFTWTAQTGTNTFKATIDGVDFNTESNESNNEKSMSIQTPVAALEEPIPAPTDTPEETTENVTSNETAEIIPGLFDDTDLPPAQAEEIPSEVSTDTSTDDSPWWQNILMNKWVIIGVGVVGIAAIFILLRLHRRAQTA